MKYCAFRIVSRDISLILQNCHKSLQRVKDPILQAAYPHAANQTFLNGLLGDDGSVCIRNWTGQKQARTSSVLMLASD